MEKTIRVLVLLVLACGPANAALQSRLSGQAYYDDVLNVTWLADATLAATSSFGVAGIGGVGPGTMNWSTAQNWITAMNAANGGLGYLGVDNWRLPTTVQPDPTCITQNSVPGFPLQGSGAGCTGSELGHLRNVNGISSASMTPFVNVQPTDYWSDTAYAPDTSGAWAVRFEPFVAIQNVVLKSLDDRHAWAVRSGDIDTDGDGITETQDNCTLVANPAQLDADGDGYGNICDADLNNSGTVTTADFGLLRSVLGQPASFSLLAAAADLNGSGTVTTADFGLLRARLGTAPGPSSINLAYLLAVAKSGTGAGTVSGAGINCGADCSEIYPRNTVVALTATGLPGSTFGGWSGACAGTGACLIEMNDAKSVSASFTLLTFALTASTTGSGTGTVSSTPSGINCGADCSENFAFNTVVTLTATAHPGSTFAGWSGACAGLGACLVTMSAARSVSAGFTVLDTNPVCASNQFLGSISGDTGAQVVAVNGVGEDWRRVQLTEDDSTFLTSVYLSSKITLTSPPGADYDLYVYCLNCGGTIAGSSTAGPGQIDTVDVRRNDVIGTDETFNVLVEVRYFAGSSSGTWNLSVAGNTAVSVQTCP